MVKKTLKWLYPLIGVFLFLSLWWIAAAVIGKELILPSPAVAVSRFFGLFREAAFWGALGMTLVRALASFGISLAAALAFAFLGRFVKPVAGILSPLVTVLRAVPTMSVIFLALIWLTSRTAPILIVCFVTFPILYETLSAALLSAEGETAEMSRVYGVGKRDMIFKMYLPTLAPSLFSAARSGIGLSVKLMVSAEALAQTKLSIGASMQLANLYLDTGGLFAWTVAAVVLSALMEGAVLLVRRLCLKWERKV